MKDHRDWRLVIGLLAGLGICAGVIYAMHIPPSVVEVPLNNVLPASYTGMRTPTSYWADSAHIVCCLQGAINSPPMVSIARRCIVVDLKSARPWHQPALDSRTTKIDDPDGWTWDYAGLSNDHKSIYVECLNKWYVAPALAVTNPGTMQAPKWTPVPVPISTQMPLISTPYETALETPKQIPVLDRFTGSDAKAISPDGTRIAWIDQKLPPESLHSLRSLLRKFHFLSKQPAYGLWLSNADGSHARCLTGFDRPDLSCYDLRWSPDEKHISCVSDSISPSAQTTPNAPNEFRLTIFDVDR